MRWLVLARNRPPGHKPCGLSDFLIELAEENPMTRAVLVQLHPADTDTLATPSFCVPPAQRGDTWSAFGIPVIVGDP